MKIEITINTGYASFEFQAGMEVARILRKLANQVEDWPGVSEFTIGARDINGNKVGQMAATVESR